MKSATRSRIAESPGAAGPLLDAGAADGVAWQDLALCAQTDPEIFFPEVGVSARRARKVCAACEVRLECLEYALENEIPCGVWGGLSEQERILYAHGKPVAQPDVVIPPSDLFLRPTLTQMRAESARKREDSPGDSRVVKAMAAVATGEKRCTGCDEVKLLSEYQKASAALDGHKARCRSCRSEARQDVAA